MIERVLIANRGEIAVRIIAACRELDLGTVAVYSTADREALHVEMADRAFCIGPPPPARSYLDQDQILAAAELGGANAIHPGYGFLAENARFAERVVEAGLRFVGPSPEAMRVMGDKIRAREAAAAAGVPLVPGSDGAVGRSELDALAESIGFPILLKAAAGGGGRGMRVVRSAGELHKQHQTATREAQEAFGDAAVYAERFVERPRHVEIQVFGDGEGRVVHLGERECSIQRRHQKLLEESPAPGLPAEVRAEMASAAVRLGAAVRYAGAGTVEFLLDPEHRFYFVEMNTRIQVEHPVTEMVSGVDLVKEQLRLASGRGTELEDLERPFGHAIECRINAEHPRTFVPSPGRIERLQFPRGVGVRVDSHVREGELFPPFYDSLLAKIVTWGRDRREAAARMSRALEELEVGGIETTAPLHRKLMRDPLFLAGRLDTGFLESFFARTDP